jgi:predicted ester cyclase
MSREANKAVVRALHQAMNQHDIEAALAYYSPESVNHAAPGAPRGRDGLRRVFTALFALFPDFHLNEEDSVAEGDKVVVRMTFSGSHQGQLPPLEPGTRDVSIPSLLAGVPASGKRFAVPVMYSHRMVDGLIVERWAVRDDLAMLAQLGIRIVGV